MGYAQLIFGNWTAACSASLGLCRVLGHVAVDGAAVPSVVGDLSGGGEYSLDGGANFRATTGGGFTWLAYFDSLAPTTAGAGSSFSSPTSTMLLPTSSSSSTAVAAAAAAAAAASAAAAAPESSPQASSSAITAQRFHWAADVRIPGYDPADASTMPQLDTICYRAWFDSGKSGAKAYVDMNATTQPPWYSGFALSPTVRCWPVGRILELP